MQLVRHNPATRALLLSKLIKFLKAFGMKALYISVFDKTNSLPGEGKYHALIRNSSIFRDSLLASGFTATQGAGVDVFTKTRNKNYWMFKHPDIKGVLILHVAKDWKASDLFLFEDEDNILTRKMFTFKKEDDDN